MAKNLTVLLAKNIFCADGTAPFNGFIAVEDNKIAAVGPADAAKTWLERADKVYDLGDRTVTPGFVDCHTFFTGHSFKVLGPDISTADNDVDAVNIIKKYLAAHPGQKFAIGRGYDPENFRVSDEKLLDCEFPDVAVAIFADGLVDCWMNSAAVDKYKFTPDQCGYSETLWRVLSDHFDDPDVKDAYRDYMKLLNARGITAIKEMSFDEYYGFAPKLKELDDAGEMTVRVSLESQPVGAPVNIEHGRRMRKLFTGDFVRFNGYNDMTDHDIADSKGELLEPYKAYPGVTCPEEQPDWDYIEKEALAADAADARFSLSTQGDGALRHVVDIYDKCKKDSNGKLVNRFSVTDMELTHPDDLKRLGKMGGIAEIYCQISLLDSCTDYNEMIDRLVGEPRKKYYFNRRGMWDAGVIVSCCTDLPLSYPDIPASIYASCGGYFGDDKSFNTQNTLTVPELLTAWTANGQYNCYNDGRLGKLKAGMLADIAVIDGDVFNTPVEKVKDMKVCLTLVDGKTVYESL